MLPALLNGMVLGRAWTSDVSQVGIVSSDARYISDMQPGIYSSDVNYSLVSFISKKGVLHSPPKMP